MNLPKYPKYKNSGVEWLGDVPEHWDVSRFKKVFKERRQKSVSGGEELLSVSSYYGVKRKLETIEEGEYLSRAESLEGYKVCEPGDLVMNIMLAWNRGLGFAWQHGIVSPSYSVFSVTDRSDPRFLDYLVRSDEYIRYFKAFSYGVIDSRLRLYPEMFGRLSCALPSSDEQSTIAAFLDHETARIDALIEEQKRLIKLLKEKRQAVISHAVTKGLDPNVPMKDSGVEWLGEVPAHWAKVRLKHVLKRIIDTEHKTAPVQEDGSYLIVRTSNVRDGALVFSDAKYTDYEGFVEWTRRGVPAPGDVLFTREAPAGEACVVPKGVDLCLGQRMVLFKPKKDRVLSDFVVYSLYAGLSEEFVESLSQGSTVAHFNMSDIGNIPLFEPPLSEQEKIVGDINRRLHVFDSLISEAKSSVDLMHERRSALISAAVTGKIDVRDWQRPASSSLTEQSATEGAPA